MFESSYLDRGRAFGATIVSFLSIPFPSWSRHQKLNASEEGSRFPAPEGSRLIEVKRRAFSKPVSNPEYSAVRIQEEVQQSINPPSSIETSSLEPDDKTSPKVLDETTIQKTDETGSENEAEIDDFLSHLLAKILQIRLLH